MTTQDPQVEQVVSQMVKSNSGQQLEDCLPGVPPEAVKSNSGDQEAEAAGAPVGRGAGAGEAGSIPKPSTFDLGKFKSKHSAAVANVETLLESLPHHSIAQAKDFVRLHPDEDEYWSPELCFVNVPIKGQKRDTFHLINEDLAMRYLPSGRIQRFRLALATKPHDVFFLCHVPSRNGDNSWNQSNLTACEASKTSWVQATSRREEGVDSYKVDSARDPDVFPAPNWPSQSLGDLIGKTFAGRVIEHEDHPGLLRLIGAKQSMS